MGFKGSRKHVLDLVCNTDFTTIMNNMLMPYDVIIADKKTVQPKGYFDTSEYRLQRYVKEHKLLSLFPTLKDFNFNSWWNPHGGSAPNWDMISMCQYKGEDALLLVEAKAHVSEFDTHGKKEKSNSSDGSEANRKNIAERIHEACAGLKLNSKGFNISVETNYQLSNRVAFSWKLNQLKIPVVLLYLGFTGDNYFKDYFRDHKHWDKAFRNYLDGVVPYHFLNSTSSEFLFVHSSLPILSN